MTSIKGQTFARLRGVGGVSKQLSVNTWGETFFLWCSRTLGRGREKFTRCRERLNHSLFWSHDGDDLLSTFSRWQGILWGRAGNEDLQPLEIHERKIVLHFWSAEGRELNRLQTDETLLSKNRTGKLRGVLRNMGQRTWRRSKESYRELRTQRT